MIKINKAYGYLIGTLFTLFVCIIGQLFFFINTEKTTGFICDIKERGGSRRYYSTYDLFYVCFATKDNISVKAEIGSNFKFKRGEPVVIIYKKNNPSNARVNQFSPLWLVHSWPYIILWGLVMALITGLFYGTRWIAISWNPRFRVQLKNR